MSARCRTRAALPSVSPCRTNKIAMCVISSVHALRRAQKESGSEGRLYREIHGTADGYQAGRALCLLRCPLAGEEDDIARGAAEGCPESSQASACLFCARDLVRKPAATFRNHAFGRKPAIKKGFGTWPRTGRFVFCL